MWFFFSLFFPLAQYPEFENFNGLDNFSLALEEEFSGNYWNYVVQNLDYNFFSIFQILTAIKFSTSPVPIWS